MTMPAKHQILIVGGGAAGITVAARALEDLVARIRALDTADVRAKITDHEPAVGG